MTVLKKWPWIKVAEDSSVQCDGYSWVLRVGKGKGDQTYHSTFLKACAYMVDKKVGGCEDLRGVVEMLQESDGVFKTLKEEIDELRSLLEQVGDYK